MYLWVERSQFWLQSKRWSIRKKRGGGLTCWYAFYQDDLCKLCTLFPQECLCWKCQDKLPEISHKIHCAGSARWRPPRSQGHWAVAVTLGLPCLPPMLWHSWLLKTSAQTATPKPRVGAPHIRKISQASVALTPRFHAPVTWQIFNRETRITLS